MAVQRSVGPPQFVPGELVIRHRGLEVGVKVYHAIGYPQILVFRRSVGEAKWNPLGDVDGGYFDTSQDREQGNRPMTAADWIAKAGGPAGFVRQHVLPRLNAVLAEVWPAQAVPSPSPAPASGGDPLEQVDSIICGLLVTMAADGTVRVEMP